MKINTKYFGEINIKSKDIIQFPQGLPGFEKEHDFLTLDLPENPVFKVLQSVGTAELAFVITNPFHIYNSYEFDLDQESIALLDMKEENAAIYAIVTLQEKFAESTLNLQAPIVINTKLFKGKQVIINTDKYSTKEPLKPETKAGVK